LLVCAAGWTYFVTYRPDGLRYPLRGVDVSHHQGEIDWSLVAADDVSFALLKATEGGDHVDNRFQENFKKARDAGLAVGAYHFFTFCRSGAEQAANFLAQVPLDQPQLPPVLDLEFGGNCSHRPTAQDLRTEIEAFLQLVEAAYGRPVIYYSIGDFEQTYRPALPPRPLWVRRLARHPDGEDWLYWQYHNRGRVAGITGPVDLNVLHGDQVRLNRLVMRPKAGHGASGVVKGL
jgi:lysozyme